MASHHLYVTPSFILRSFRPEQCSSFVTTPDFFVPHLLLVAVLACIVLVVLPGARARHAAPSPRSAGSAEEVRPRHRPSPPPRAWPRRRWWQPPAGERAARCAPHAAPVPSCSTHCLRRTAARLRQRRPRPRDGVSPTKLTAARPQERPAAWPDVLKRAINGRLRPSRPDAAPTTARQHPTPNDKPGRRFPAVEASGACRAERTKIAAAL